MAARDSAPNRTGYLALYNALLALRGGENELNRHISRGSFYTQPLPVMIRDIQYLINSKDPGRRFPQTIRKEDVPQYFNSLLKELNSHTEHDYFGKIELGLKRNNWSDLPPPPEEKIVSQPVNIPIETAEVIPVETDQVPETSKVTKEKEEPKYRGGGGVTKKPEEKTSENKAVVVPNPVTKTTVRNIVRSRLQNKAEITQIIRSAPRQQTPEAPTITRSSPETLPPKRPSAIKINLKQAQNAVSSTMGGPAKNLASNAIVQIIRHPGFKANLFSAGIGALGGGLIGGSLPAAGVGAVLGGLAGPEIGDRIGDYMTGGRGGGGGSIQNSIKRRAQNAAEALTRRAARRAALAIGRVLIANSWWLVPLIGIILLLLIAILISLCILPWSGCEGSGGTNDLSKQIVIKKSAPLQVENGGSIEYKITVTNNGSAPTNVVVNDDLPADTVYETGDNDPVAEGTSVKKIQWNIKSLSPKQTKTLTFKVKPQKENMWVVNQVTGTASILGAYGSSTGLLPNPLPSETGNWSATKDMIIEAVNKYPEVVAAYQKASSLTGVPWEVLAGLHFVETGNNPRPTASLVSGRQIGIREPDIPASACADSLNGPGVPIPMGGGCGFSNFEDSAIYSAKHIMSKIEGRVPTTFQDAVTALSRYNGGGNSNCGRGVPYNFCPEDFDGEDDPYAMNYFDQKHTQMYLIYCADLTKCNPPQPFGRPGAMAVIRALLGK